jgi:hypothetical protein
MENNMFRKSNTDKALEAAQSFKRTMVNTANELPTKTLARVLGWTSFAIGFSEILMPRRLEKLLGIGRGRYRGIFRILGVREILHGLDILTHKDPTPGVWSRVAGDGLDGVLLGIAATKTRRPGGFATGAAMVLPVVLLDLLVASRLHNRRR